MGRLHAAKPLFIWRYWWGAFSGGNSHSCSPWKIVQLLLEEGIPEQSPSLLEGFCSTILSTMAARSKLGQGVSCFCPEIIFGGDDHSAFFLHGQLLDGLVECGWEKGSSVEACKAEFQSFVREQRHLERHSTRKRPDVGNILAFFAQQTGFQSRRHLFRVCCRTSIGWTLL